MIEDIGDLRDRLEAQSDSDPELRREREGWLREMEARYVETPGVKAELTKNRVAEDQAVIKMRKKRWA